MHNHGSSIRKYIYIYISFQLNTTVNTFKELEKLKLSKSKCHKVNVGKLKKNCPDMKVHGEPMSESKSEKYLGDIIHRSGNPKPNIARRLSRGWGKVNEILDEGGATRKVEGQSRVAA